MAAIRRAAGFDLTDSFPEELVAWPLYSGSRSAVHVVSSIVIIFMALVSCAGLTACWLMYRAVELSYLGAAG